MTDLYEVGFIKLHSALGVFLERERGTPDLSLPLCLSHPALREIPPGMVSSTSYFYLS